MKEGSSFRSANRNMQSATSNPEVIEDYLSKEGASGNILGPFTLESATKVHINRIGAILKKHQTGKWRVITDLSFPEGANINDAIDPTLC